MGGRGADLVCWIGIPAIVLSVGGGWWLMRKALAPVAALTEAARRINEHNLGERLPRSGDGDELDQLTEVFNAMTERLEQSFKRIREFTLHASHELKTPLTVMRGELETALAGPEPAAAPARVPAQPAGRTAAPGQNRGRTYPVDQGRCGPGAP